MNIERKSGAVLLALPLVFLSALGCSTYSTYKPVILDCTADSNYDLDPVDLSTGFGYGDTTTGAAQSFSLTTIPDGPRCGNASALKITAHHYNDWGAATGFYGFITNAMVRPYRDESAYTGMSFWARAPGATGKSFTIVLDDFNTYDPTPLPAGSTNPADDPNPGDSNCISYSTPDGGTTGQNITIYDPGTGMVLSSNSTTVTAVNACGNGYNFVATVTGDWAFYTVPFGMFHQTAMPNRVPNAKLMEIGTAPGTTLLTSRLSLLTLRSPKEAEMELWIDKLGFYRTKGPGAGTDGGADSR